MAFSARIGLLVPSSNTTVETEFARVLPKEVTLHVARLFIASVETESIGKMAELLAAQARLVASADVDVIVLGAAAPSFLKGLGYDQQMTKIIEDATGKAATTTSTALLEALKALGISKLALGAAYIPAVNDLCANFLTANGHTVVSQAQLGLSDNLAIGRLDVSTAYELAKKLDTPEAQAIVLACTNWKSVDVIDKLEQELQKPVLSTSQVSIWAALRKVGYQGRIEGYGELLHDFSAMRTQYA
jgi:maleate isomerase